MKEDNKQICNALWSIKGNKAGQPIENNCSAMLMSSGETSKTVTLETAVKPRNKGFFSGLKCEQG